MAYLHDALGWIGADIAARGGRVIAAALHWDEEHLHMHVLSIADNGLARELHPGFVAKNSVLDRAEPGENGRLPSHIHHNANAAYDAAMRNWLDNFHREVGARHGLARRSRTPMRRRSWLECHLSRLREEAAQMQGSVSDLRYTLESLIESNQEEADRASALEQRTITAQLAKDEAERREEAALLKAVNVEWSVAQAERTAEHAERRKIDGEAAIEALATRWRKDNRVACGLRVELSNLATAITKARTDLIQVIEAKEEIEQQVERAKEDADQAVAVEATSRSAVAECEATIDLRQAELDEIEERIKEAKRTDEALRSGIEQSQHREDALDRRGAEILLREAEFNQNVRDLSDRLCDVEERELRCTEHDRKLEEAAAAMAERDERLAVREELVIGSEEAVSAMEVRASKRTSKVAEMYVVLRDALERVAAHERHLASGRRDLSHGMDKLDRTIRRDLNALADTVNDPASLEMISAVRKACESFTTVGASILAPRSEDTRRTNVNIQAAMQIDMEKIAEACAALDTRPIAPS